MNTKIHSYKIWEDELRTAVSKLFEVPWIKLISKSRHRKLMNARHSYCYLAYAKGNTYRNIGKMINREHTTVIRSVKKVKDLYDINDPVIVVIEQIKQAINF